MSRQQFLLSFATAAVLACGIGFATLFPGSGSCAIAYQTHKLEVEQDKLSQHLLSSVYGVATKPDGMFLAERGKEQKLPSGLVFRVSRIGQQFCKLKFEQPTTVVSFSSLGGKLPQTHFKQAEEVSIAERLPEEYTMSQASDRAKYGVQTAYILHKSQGGTYVHALWLAKPE